MSSSVPRLLPARPSVEQLKHQARDLQRAFQRGDPAAIARLQPYFPNATIASHTQTLLVLAREYGYSNWAKLSEAARRATEATAKSFPVPGFSASMPTIHMLVGPTCSLKTWLALDVALAVVTGTPMLGQAPVPTPVLVVDSLEMSQAIMNRVHRLSRGRGWASSPSGILYLDSRGRQIEYLLGDIERSAVRHGTRLVILDGTDLLAASACTRAALRAVERMRTVPVMWLALAWPEGGWAKPSVRQRVDAVWTLAFGDQDDPDEEPSNRHLVLHQQDRSVSWRVRFSDDNGPVRTFYGHPS